MAINASIIVLKIIIAIYNSACTVDASVYLVAEMHQTVSGGSEVVFIQNTLKQLTFAYCHCLFAHIRYGIALSIAVHPTLHEPEI